MDKSHRPRTTPSGRIQIGNEECLSLFNLFYLLFSAIIILTGQALALDWALGLAISIWCWKKK